MPNAHRRLAYCLALVAVIVITIGMQPIESEQVPFATVVVPGSTPMVGVSATEVTIFLSLPALSVYETTLQSQPALVALQGRMTHRLRLLRQQREFLQQLQELDIRVDVLTMTFVDTNSIVARVLPEDVPRIQSMTAVSGIALPAVTNPAPQVTRPTINPVGTRRAPLRPPGYDGQRGE